MFDKDGGGSISTDEIKTVLSFGQTLDESVINSIIKQVDENGDGEISFEEFAVMMHKNIQWAKKGPWAPGQSLLDVLHEIKNKFKGAMIGAFNGILALSNL